MKPEEIAFKDFTSSITVGEFEAILTLCKNQYDRIKILVEKREEFINKTTEKFSQAQEMMPLEGQEGLKKIINALVKKADQELYKAAYDEVQKIGEITEFLQRFNDVDSYPHLDVSFLDKIKTQ